MANIVFNIALYSATSAGRAVLSWLCFVGTLAAWLTLFPQFEILKPVVTAITVFMMYVFVVVQSASDVTRHYQTMLQHCVLATGARTLKVILGWIKKHCDIALWTGTPPTFVNRVATAASTTTIIWFMTGVAQRVCYLVRVCTDTYGDLSARFTGFVSRQYFPQWQWRNRFPTTRSTNTDTESDEHSTYGFVVVAVGITKCCYAFSGHIARSKFFGNLRRDISWFGHAVA